MRPRNRLLVLLNSTEPSPYDVYFSILGFPVRIHWTFWLGCLLLGSSGDLQDILIFTVVALISILVHELGHTFAMRYFGRSAHIVLQWLGGLAIEGRADRGSGVWQDYSSSYATPRRRTTTEQIIISLAGPVVGLLLAGVVSLIVVLTGGEVSVHFDGFIPFPVAVLNEGTAPLLRQFVFVMLWFNVFVNIINLLPVWPLDGGQIAQALFVANDPYQGQTKAFQLSFVVAVLMAVAGLVVMGSSFMALFFGSLAFTAYQALTMGGGGGRRGGW